MFLYTDENKELGHVVLYVTDLTRMADFYEHTLGFHQISREWPVAFSGGRTYELLLIEVGGQPKVADTHGSRSLPYWF